MEPPLREKLDPALLQMLGALRTQRQEGNSDAPSGEQEGFAANLLNGLLCVVGYILGRVEPEDLSPAPVTAESTTEESALALARGINAVAPLVQATAQMEFLEAWPDFIERARAKSGEEPRQIVKSALAMANAIEGSAEPVEKVFTTPMLKAVCSIRSNRNPQAAFQKLSHHVILTYLFLFGALKKTSSHLYCEALTIEETRQVFDWCCPACQHHSAEALRKTVERFLRDTLRKWPDDKIRAGRSRAGSIEIRHSGSPKFRRGQPRVR